MLKQRNDKYSETPQYSKQGTSANAQNKENFIKNILVEATTAVDMQTGSNGGIWAVCLFVCFNL